MSDAPVTKPRTAVGRKLVLAVMAVGVLALFASSLYYRFNNPDLTRNLSARAQAPASMAGQGGMTGMDMEAVRTMLESLEARVAENPGDLEALFQLANIQVMRGDKTSAMAWLNQARGHAGDEKAALQQLAMTYYELQAFPEAAEMVRILLEMDPDDMHARYNLGILYKYRLERSEEARALFEEVVRGSHSNEQLRADAEKEL